MSRYAGLHIHGKTLRLAIFEGTPKKYALVAYKHEAIEADSEEERQVAIQGVLGDILADKQNRGMEIVSAIDARHAILREITVPYTRDDQISKTIRFEAESYIHAYAIEELIVEYLKCSEKDGSSRLLVAAVPKEVIGSHLAELKAAGVDPSVVELDVTALASTFVNSSLFDPEQNQLLVELEHGTSHLVLFQGGRIVKVRSIWSRGRPSPPPDRMLESGTPAPNNSDSEVERRFQQIERSLLSFEDSESETDPLHGDEPIAVISDEEFARLTGSKDRGEDQGDSAEPSANEGTTKQTSALALATDVDPLEQLFIEIERTFAGYVLSHPIDRIVVTGNRYQELDAVHRIGERFEIETLPLELDGAFPVQWDGEKDVLNREGGTACGLALRALGKGATALDLRKDEFRYERRFEKLMPALTQLGFLCLILSLLWSMQMYNAKMRHEKEVLALANFQRQIYEAFFDRKATGNSTYGAAKTELTHMKGTGGRSSRIEQYLGPMEVFDDLTQAISRSNPRVYPKYRGFDIDPSIDKDSRTTIKLAVGTQDDAMRLVDAVKKYTKLYDCRESIDPPDKDGLREVTLTLNLKPSVVATRGK